VNFLKSLPMCRLPSCIVGLVAVFGGLGQAAGNEPVGPFRSQSFALEAGWNAIYLEIEPREQAPNELFAGTPIEIVAAYNRPVTAMEFIDSPGAVLPDRKGWNVWYAPQREDAVLGNLSLIQAHHSYLVFSKTAFTWTFEGTAFFGSGRWHPHAYSLVGFPIDPAEQPTVAQFFAGAKAHVPLRIYRMAGGQWNQITQPAQVLMKPGAAYWVLSEGASSYRGPLTVEFSGSSAGGLVFNESAASRVLVIRNVSPFPQSLTCTLQGGTTGLLPLAYVVTQLDGPAQPVASVAVPFPSPLKIGPLEPGASFALELEVVQEQVSLPVMSTTLTISSTAGPRIEVPMISLRPDRLAAP
jgi:hypothetical protein